MSLLGTTKSRYRQGITPSLVLSLQISAWAWLQPHCSHLDFKPSKYPAQIQRRCSLGICIVADHSSYGRQDAREISTLAMRVVLMETSSRLALTSCGDIMSHTFAFPLLSAETIPWNLVNFCIFYFLQDCFRRHTGCIYCNMILAIGQKIAGGQKSLHKNSRTSIQLFREKCKTTDVLILLI